MSFSARTAIGKQLYGYNKDGVHANVVAYGNRPCDLVVETDTASHRLVELGPGDMFLLLGADIHLVPDEIKEFITDHTGLGPRP